VAMSGGIARRPKRAKPVPEPAPEMAEDEPEAQPEMVEDEPEDDAVVPVDPGPPVDEEHPEDPEDHFVADDDATLRATRDGKSETAAD